MPTVTVSGASGAGVVTSLTTTTASTAAIAQSAFNSISGLFSNFGQANINAGTVPGGQIVGSLGGTAQGNYGTLTATIPSNVIALTINNTGATSVTNTRFVGSETVLAGAGTLTFTDNASSTSIVTGGGNNTITFSQYSQNGTFVGDGTNTINVNAATGASSIYGTAASADTIVGSASGSGIVYTSATGSTAFINPLASNVTVFGAGGTGSTTVFGGVGNQGTGRLTVTDGTGLFQGGTAGKNMLGSSSIGGTTLMGGGGGDVLQSKGANDLLKAGGLGSSTLDSSYSVGGDTLMGSSSGASLIYASQTIGDTIYTTNSTFAGVGFVGEFIQLHTGPNSLLRSLNASVSSTIIGGGGVGNSGAQFATMGDFISGVDKLLLVTSVVGTASLTTGSIATGNGPLLYSNVTTSNGSLFTFYNTTLTQNDIKTI